MTHAQQYLDRLVDELMDGGWIRSPTIERAFRAVQRHRFLREFSLWDPETSKPVAVEFDPEGPSDDALWTIYSDQALGTRFRDGVPTSSSSQPSIMANMLEALAPERGMRVLEIGTGTGYNAALLAEIVGSDGFVGTLDIDADVSAEARGALEAMGYDRIRVLTRDGAEGLPADSPFDRILATVGCPDVAPAWHEQLAEGGRLVAPLEHAGLQPLISLTRRAELLEGVFVGWAGFIPIRGRLHQQLPWPDVVLKERERDALAESPVWDGFGTGPSLAGWGVPRDVMDFFLFLALWDTRAAVLPPPSGSTDNRWEVGLLGTSGWALAGQGTVHGAGDPRLLSDLMGYHESWLVDGCPRLEDWRVTFAPRNGEETERALFVEREHYNEKATLPDGS